MDGHHSGYHLAAAPPQNPRLFLKPYGIFTHFLPYLYDFLPDPCHPLEESFTRAIRPGIVLESLPAPPEHEGHHKLGLCESESVDETLACSVPLSLHGEGNGRRIDVRVLGTGIDVPCVVSPSCPGKQSCLAPGGVPHMVRSWLLGPQDGDDADSCRPLQGPQA